MDTNDTDAPPRRELRTEALQCQTTLSNAQALDRFRAEKKWSRSTAIEHLIEKGLGL